ncbi:hypothetical protein [Thermococcus henrietii]|uniref:hypothetical protein n=1 Tax=Thermococcus henrietii TaxID=2016361 RepID=UPI000C08B30C|nr:hypothetical protein [Thermococcus henrietii]
MAGIKIVGASHPGRFTRELAGEGAVEGESTERYSAEFTIGKHRCRVVHNYSTGEVLVWFEDEATVDVLRRILKLTRYLGRALAVGVLPGREIKGEAFIEVPGGRIGVVHAGEGLWIGWDGTNWFFSATVQGIAELIEILGAEP